MAGHGLTGVPDAGAFLARLTRLDPGAAVRLRGSGGRTALWARLPWDVLVTREVAGRGPDDATVSAAELLAVLGAGGGQLAQPRGGRRPRPGRGRGLGRRVAGGAGRRWRSVARAAGRAVALAVAAGRERDRRDGLRGRADPPGRRGGRHAARGVGGRARRARGG